MKVLGAANPGTVRLEFSLQVDDQLLFLLLRISNRRLPPNQQTKVTPYFILAGDDGLSENEDPGASAGGAAEGKFSHGGVLDGGKEAEKTLFYFLRVPRIFDSVIPPILIVVLKRHLVREA